MILTPLALMLALTLFASAALAQGATSVAAWGEERVAEQPVIVRHKPDLIAPSVRTLRSGDHVRVDFIQPNGWAALFDMSETQRELSRAIGYAELRLLTPVAQAKVFKNAPAPARAPQPKVEALAAPKVEPKAEAKAEPKAPPKVETKPDAKAEAQPAAQPAAKPADKPMAKPPVPSAPKPAQHTAPDAPASKPEPRSAPAAELKGEVKAHSAQPTGQASSAAKQAPVRITSDKMVYNQNENSVVFLGNVHGAQEDMAIWAAKVTAYFSPKAKDQKSKDQKDKGSDKPGDFGDKIERIVAEGSVRMVAGKNEGACGLLTYFVADGVLRMEQNPILREGQNTIRGDVIKYYMNENRSEVLSGAQRRVEAVFFSPKADGK